MKFLWVSVVVAICVSACSNLQDKKISVPDENETRFLEDAEGKEALNWAAQRKEKAQKALSMYSGYAKLKQQVESILFDQRKTLFGGIVDGYVYNFWKDETHPQGVWRRTTLDEYKKPYPNWDVLIDFDILSKKMGQKIVARNFVRCKQQKNLFLIHMSFGGKDEIVFQEWDLNTRNFVENGFASKNAKGEWVGAKLVGASWIDSNQIVAATYKDKKELSNSGYATAVYLWKRGQTQAQAQSLLNIPKDHVLVSSGRILDGKNDPVVLLSDHKDFYNSTEYLWSEADGLQKVQMPSDSSFLYWFKDQVFYKLNSELNIDGRQIPAGAVVAMNWKDMLRPHDKKDSFEVIFTPSSKEVFYSLNVTKNEVLLHTSYNVSSKLYRLTLDKGKWSALSEVALPLKHPSISITSDKEDDKALFFVENSVTPPTVYFWDSSQSLTLLRKPLFVFDSGAFEVTQYEAKSLDGTRVPYFVVNKKGMKFDGKNPTVLQAYGGFEVINKPYFSRLENEIWVKNGGVTVLANIRGGGEFGPQWHKAALKENRQKSFDDFIVVAEDLIERNITSPKHLGIEGGSNGGLLVSVAMTQRPQLFGAVVCEVPILDMLRYTEFGAGHSWVAEYGDPKEAKISKVIRKYAPLENLYVNREYPPVLITGSAVDQRTHPWHSRIFQYMLERHPEAISYYLESADSGHGGGASLKDWVEMYTNKLAFYNMYLR